MALRKSPQSFFIGGLSLMVAIQLISLAIVSLQTKKYFEELFHLGSGILYRSIEEDEESSSPDKH